MQKLLLIKVGDGWEPLDLLDESIPLNFQIGDLGNLRDRKAAYSQSIRIPMTPRNSKIFEFLDAPQLETNIPYRITECRYYEDGIEIIGPDHVFQINELSTDNGGARFINGQIIGNVTGLFRQMEQDPVEVLGPMLGLVTWDFADFQASFAGQRWYKWCLSAVNSRMEGIGEVYNHIRNLPYPPSPNVPVFAYQFQLYVPYLELVRKTLAQYGYDLETDIENNPSYSPVWIPLNNLVPRSGIYQGMGGTAFGPKDTVMAAPDDYRSLFEYLVSSTINPSLHGIYDAMPDPDNAGTYYQGLVYCSPSYSRIKLIYTSQTEENVTIRYRVRRFSQSTNAVPDQIVLDAQQDAPAGGDTFTSAVIELYPNEPIWIEAILIASPEGNPVGCDVKIQIQEGTPVGPGATFNISDIIGFDTPYQIVKTFAQMFGLFVELSGQTVRMLSLNNLITNAQSGQYYDWTSKIDAKSSTSNKFVFNDYAKYNNIKLQANEALNVQDSITLTVDNENVLGVRDIFELPFETSRDIELVYPLSRSEAQYLNAPRFFSNNEDAVTIYQGTPTRGPIYLVPKFKYQDSGISVCKVPTKMVSTYTTKDVWVIPQYSGLPFTRTNYPTNTIDVVNAYDIVGIVGSYFAVIQNSILSRVKIVSANFNLTAMDIEGISLFNPVYLEQYGQFFYIQKINNYISGELTNVELVSLNI